MAAPLDVAEYIDRYPCDEDCHWEAEHFSFKTLPAIVERVHFCAANNEQNEVMVKGAEPVNHWMIFLQTGAKTSVRDVHRLTLLPACRVVEHHRAGITVERVFRMLIENGRDRYKFTDQHVGCRYWCYCVAADFERQGWVSRGLAERVYQEASWYYPDIKNTRDNFRVHSPIVAATFF
ncbi:hypothetical protein BDZ89DRAFT_56728 [Hymenopellis radicata]|nr:hypothetical protein BDZ89DRAFT_56728 [Hymenopellis radicata]